MKRLIAAVALCALTFAGTGGGARAGLIAVPAETGRFYNILPPGQHGSTNILEALQYEAQGTRPSHSDDQLGMYADLVYNSPGLADADIEKYFKKAGFTVDPADVTRTETPKTGLTIVRDTFDVPHIYGDSQRDVYFGTGYVTAEDRLFFTDVLRHVGRGRLAEFLGASPSNLAMDQGIAQVAGYSERELQLQVDLMPLKFGTLGQQAVEAVHGFIDGMNARVLETLTDPTKLPAEYPALQVVPTLWKPTDVIAIATLIQAVFAAGGGGELSNAQFIQALDKKYPSGTTAHAIYRDLLNRDDPDAPVTIKPGDTTDVFPYQVPDSVDPASVAIPDEGSVAITNPLKTLRDLLTDAGIMLPQLMSNWIGVTADRTAAGHPIAVMGPQTGYFSPQILMEIDAHGGGIDARGATFPGISLWVLLGRGIDFAWSATSGESDLVDIRVEKLCEPDGSAATTASSSYLFNGTCTKMYERTDIYAAKPSAGGIAEPTIIRQHIERTGHGPVFGRATVGGAPVALVIQRSTFFGEADSSPTFILLNTNRVHDAQSFLDAMNYETGSFNWLYVDSKDVAYVHAGLYPRRAAHTDNELPVWGTGEWEWNGYLSQNEHPHVINPASGYIASWNNKPVRGWRASDSNYEYTPIHRVQSLTERLAPKAAAGGVTVTDMIDVMEGAATVDLRGTQVLPSALQVLGSDPDTDAYTAILSSWVANGAHRKGPKGSATYAEGAAVALMDAWYDRMIHAIFDPQLDGLYGPLPLGFDDGNRLNHIGSSFQGGFYGPILKTLKQRLGQSVGDPYASLECGADLASCRATLKSSLLAAVTALGGTPADWKVDKAIETIRFSAIGLVAMPEIDWQNRPTFQQVVQVFSTR